MKTTTLLLLSPLLAAAATAPEHSEFDATLLAPYRAQAPGRRLFTLSFDYPDLRQPKRATWRLDITRKGASIARWRGHIMLRGAPLTVRVAWTGAAPAGVYAVRMTATTGAEQIMQQWDIQVGRASAPAQAVLPIPLPPPFDVYLGNLHSQTNHSDGGGPLATCHGAQPPQSAPFGPRDAFDYAQRHGLDFLMASEHNHMYDGSDGANPDADAGAARARFHSGLADAAAFSAAHPGFQALYGLEWGVIAGGGHLNIFNATELLGWETGKDGALVADTLTPRSDYAGLYTLMRTRGWIGQFNHPATTGQFVVGGVALGYTADGDAAMALCEVMNSSAFSSNDTETEPRRSNFEAACNKALEAGYHVAFSSDQDNHCANWGMSYTNRTGVLVARGQPFTRAAMLEAIGARRVFATMDKTAQLVFTANGHVMGERFANTGALTLVVHFASSAGKQMAAVQIMQGVPGRNGAVTPLAEVAVTTITPPPGEHFYYARVTQDDGAILWSAPVWVSQQPVQF